MATLAYSAMDDLFTHNPESRAACDEDRGGVGLRGTKGLLAQRR